MPITRRTFCRASSLTIAGGACTWLAADAAETSKATFTLWQLPNQTHTQMMSYVLRSRSGKLIVIDGGNAGDGKYLAEFLAGLGNVVDAWFISHPHSDHFGALVEILKQPGSLEIKNLYASMPTKAWIDEFTSDSEKASFDRYVEGLAKAERSPEDLLLGRKMEIDGIQIEVLGVKNPEITVNPINNSSVVLRVWDSTKSILFLADLGAEGGDKLLASPLADRIPCDYVQMAHHGQTGVNEAFYRKVGPTYCLWPTPLWLWNNDKGGGKGTGPWRTLEVRGWMDKLPIKAHYLMFEGLAKID